ncbi:hypothetical protein D3C71_1947010 [compost metagenome]
MITVLADIDDFAAGKPLAVVVAVDVKAVANGIAHRCCVQQQPVEVLLGDSSAGILKHADELRIFAVEHCGVVDGQGGEELFNCEHVDLHSDAANRIADYVCHQRLLAE